MTIDQVKRSLDDDASQQLKGVEAAQRGVDRQTDRLQASQRELRRRIAAAMEAGVPVMLLADRLQVTTKRVYQMAREV